MNTTLPECARSSVDGFMLNSHNDPLRHRLLSPFLQLRNMAGGCRELWEEQVPLGLGSNLDIYFLFHSYCPGTLDEATAVNGEHRSFAEVVSIIMVCDT